MRRPINKIIIQFVSVKDAAVLIADHVETKGMPEVGFHYMIEPDGTTMVGRSVSDIGNHLVGYNADSIGVALIGEVFTKKHELAIDSLLEELSVKEVNTNNVFIVENDEMKKYK